MKFTNYYDLPQPLVDLVTEDHYNKGDCDFSITELLKPPRIRRLEDEHYDDIEVDVRDELWKFFGKIVHAMLEKRERTAIPEKRYFTQLANSRISGQVDRLSIEAGNLQDYKFTKVWKVQKGDPQEWEEQLNSYRYLLFRNGIAVNSADVVAFLRDWSVEGIERSEGYPQAPFVRVPIKLWTIEQTEHFLLQRIHMHKMAAGTLPLCTDRDRWKDPDTWAVMKGDGKRAVRCYDDKNAALLHAQTFGDGYHVKFRPSIPKRCERHCTVNQWCDQYQNSLEEK